MSFQVGDWVVRTKKLERWGEYGGPSGPIQIKDRNPWLRFEDISNQGWIADYFRHATQQEREAMSLEDSREDWAPDYAETIKGLTEELKMQKTFGREQACKVVILQGEKELLETKIKGTKEYINTLEEGITESPLLWDRITGEGPFIKVHLEEQGFNKDRGMICVYRGNRRVSAANNQARDWVWPETLTETRPTSGITPEQLAQVEGLAKDWESSSKSWKESYRQVSEDADRWNKIAVAAIFWFCVPLVGLIYQVLYA